MKEHTLTESINFRCTSEMKEAAELAAKSNDPDRPEAGAYARKVLRHALIKRGILK